MKKLRIILFAAGVLAVSACQEDTINLPVYSLLDPVAQDAAAGDWQTVWRLDFDQLGVTAPASVQSTAYQEELQALAVLTQNRTPSDEEGVAYWGSGGVLRWNEVGRKLVAQYNVPPASGALPTPDKPFANPPVAARVYALLSVGQHDALVAAWHFKYLYNRPAPGSQSNAIDRAWPATGLPAYPSEQSVIAVVSKEILAALFPAETAYLDSLMEAHIRSAQLAGAATASDIAAGAVIGRAIASRVKSYADTDRMKLAGDPEDIYKIIVPFSQGWQCLEKPLLKPMLPLYGSVKTWFDSAAVYTLMPPPPPRVGSPAFNEDIAQVRRYADKRSREQWRIADFWADGGGTPPPRTLEYYC